MSSLEVWSISRFNCPSFPYFWMLGVSVALNCPVISMFRRCVTPPHPRPRPATGTGTDNLAITRITHNSWLPVLAADWLPAPHQGRISGREGE